MTPAEKAVFVERALRDAGVACHVQTFEVERGVGIERATLTVVVDVLAIHPRMNVAQINEVKP
jgi:hypothetical protein